ncbi:hypothetical protein [Tenacibaculum amylolyticum]|uniref:hypothetical protein n=1 Tax=Tenacibaculum amylolyticum TaxID=104269 RepID=UPI003895166B
MSTTTLSENLVQNEAFIEGYDFANAAEWCSPSFLKCKICMGASATRGKVTLTASFKTPIKNFTKRFTFDSNVSFTWQPISRFKVTLKISNLTINDHEVSFDVSAKISVKVPVFGWKSKTFKHHFDVPVFNFEQDKALDNIDDAAFTYLLASYNEN